MASFEKLEDLNRSLDELKSLNGAACNDEFRKLLNDYSEKIAKLKIKSRYAAEKGGSETERGMHLDPGYVIKASVSSGIKVFINVCKSESVSKPSATKQVGVDGRSGLAWNLPHTFLKLVEDGKERCKIFDFVIHPDTYRMAETNGRFKKMLSEMAVEGIGNEFGIHIDANRLRFPKMKYKGVPASKENCKIVAVENHPDSENSLKNSKGGHSSSKEQVDQSEENMQTNKQEMDPLNNDCPNHFCEPKYTLTHHCKCALKHELANGTCLLESLHVDVDLPLIKSAAELTLDIFERKVCLVSELPSRYKLDVTLPCLIDENESRAKFVKSKRWLSISLPVISESVIPQKPEVIRGEEENSVTDQNVVAGIEASGMHDQCATPEPAQTHSDETVEGANYSPVRNAASKLHESKSHHHSSPNSFKDDSFHLPDFTYRQDSDAVSFVFHVGNVKREDMSIVTTSHGVCLVRIVVKDADGSVQHFSCCLKFEDGCCFGDEGYTVDVSESNVVLVLRKDEPCRKLWHSFWTGIHLNSLQKREFVTAGNLMRALDGLDAESVESRADVISDDSSANKSPTLQVTQMDNEKLVILMEKAEENDKVSRSSSDSSEIIVVHEKCVPKLHGILKQRTMSESSELSGAERQVSTATGSDADDSDYSPDGGTPVLSSSVGSGARVFKKSVSFSDRIDRTLFQVNQSVSSMHNVLKNRRRRARKRDMRLEQKEQMKEERRRRRHSSGGSLSMEDSGDEPQVAAEAEDGVPVAILPGDSLPEKAMPKSIATGKSVKSSAAVKNASSSKAAGMTKTKAGDASLIENVPIMTSGTSSNGTAILGTKQHELLTDCCFGTSGTSIKINNKLPDDKVCDMMTCVTDSELNKPSSSVSSDLLLPCSEPNEQHPPARCNEVASDGNTNAMSSCNGSKSFADADGLLQGRDVKCDNLELANSLMFALDME